MATSTPGMSAPKRTIARAGFAFGSLYHYPHGHSSWSNALVRSQTRNYMLSARAGTLLRWGDSREEAMKILSVFALTTALAAVPISAQAAKARVSATAFDGSWSVLILTQSGSCDRAYRAGVQISNSEVFNAGGEPIALRGHVAPNGAVRVSVAAGAQEAHGAGRLSRTSGGGTWQGQGSLGTCAGTWQAERRR